MPFELAVGLETAERAEDLPADRRGAERRVGPALRGAPVLERCAFPLYYYSSYHYHLFIISVNYIHRQVMYAAAASNGVWVVLCCVWGVKSETIFREFEKGERKGKGLFYSVIWRGLHDGDNTNGFVERKLIRVKIMNAVCGSR